jgi:hypothetical protein
VPQVLSECNANFIFRSPDGPAGALDALNNDVEKYWDSICRGYLKTSARRRQVSDGAVKFGSLFAKDYLRVFENTLAEDGSFVLHVTIAQNHQSIV